MRIAFAALSLCGLLLAQQPAPSVSTLTQRIPFPPGGTLHLVHSFGYLSITAWDLPEMELTTTKSVHLALDPLWTEKTAAAPNVAQLRVTVQRKGNEILVATGPHHDIDIAYSIHVPRDARIVVEHGDGGVYVDGLTSDVHATVRQGIISLRLPQRGQYGIDAKTDLGDIVSDYPGRPHRRPWIFAHGFTEPADSHPKLFLRAGYGDILILKIRRPAPPAPLILQ